MNTGIQADKLPQGESQVDTMLVTTVIALLSLGTIMVYSATIASDSQTLEISYKQLVRHLAHIGVGGCLMFLAILMRLNWLQASSRALLLIGLAMLLVLFIPGVGVEVNGSLRWLNAGSFRIQPSELVKVFAIIYFADYLARKRDDLHLFKVGIINIGLVVGAIGLLLLLQPDFGTAAVVIATVAGMMFLAGVRFWHYVVSVGIAGSLMTALMWMEPYRVARLMSYRDPWADPFGSGFQLAQALIAIGRGEWFGTGLGSSIQKLFYLPHAGNDFIIAVIAEELGAAGVLIVIALFCVLLWRAFVIADKALARGDRFAGFVAQGVGVLLALQAVIHIGVNTGLLPTKGLTLPLMSYGGSSILSSMLAIGLLLAVDRQSREGRRLST
ncbi:MAG: putative lipid II flippase FtsW [Pseudomonadota bacterium]